jgi:hypothetical protein
MHMVRHDAKRARRNMQIITGQVILDVLNDLAGLVQSHCPVLNFPEYTFAAVSYDGDELRAGSGIIVSL